MEHPGVAAVVAAAPRLGRLALVVLVTPPTPSEHALTALVGLLAALLIRPATLAGRGQLLPGGYRRGQPAPRPRQWKSPL